MNNENNKLKLSAKRTTLANKRTFLSYFRTSVGCLSVAFAFIKLHENEPIDPFTIILFVLSGIFMIVGIAETIIVKKQIAKLANTSTDPNED